jgi:hypothetical protein
MNRLPLTPAAHVMVNSGEIATATPAAQPRLLQRTRKLRFLAAEQQSCWPHCFTIGAHNNHWEIGMNVAVVLSRALSGVGKKTIYKSPGRMPSFASAAWPQGALNDCSGFVSWCLRFSESRKVDHPLYRRVNGGWFETTAIYQDGLESTGYFQKIDSPEPGALLVYPDYRDAGGATMGMWESWWKVQAKE